MGHYECIKCGKYGCLGDCDKYHQQPTPTADIEGVKRPQHYYLFDDVEVIEVIARSMTREQFKGYVLGNILKYRLRAGKKGELAYLEKDMAKADYYQTLYEKFKGYCHE